MASCEATVKAVAEAETAKRELQEAIRTRFELSREIMVSLVGSDCGGSNKDLADVSVSLAEALMEANGMTVVRPNEKTDIGKQGETE